MISESVSIIIVGALLASVFVGYKNRDYALATLPVIVIPVMNLLIRFVLYLSKGHFFGFRAGIVIAFFNVLAIGLSCWLIVIFSNRFKYGRIKKAYRVMMLFYCIILGWAYVYNAIDLLVLA